MSFNYLFINQLNHQLTRFHTSLLVKPYTLNPFRVLGSQSLVDYCPSSIDQQSQLRPLLKSNLLMLNSALTLMDTGYSTLSSLEPQNYSFTMPLAYLPLGYSIPQMCTSPRLLYMSSFTSLSIESTSINYCPCRLMVFKFQSLNLPHAMTMNLKSLSCQLVALSHCSR